MTPRTSRLADLDGGVRVATVLSSAADLSASLRDLPALDLPYAAGRTARGVGGWGAIRPARTTAATLSGVEGAER
jgi:hypothetical protein